MIDERLKLLVWRKGEAIPGYDPSRWRRDCYGATIMFGELGNRDFSCGWEIDRIVPDVPQAVANLRPVHWKNVARR